MTNSSPTLGVEKAKTAPPSPPPKSDCEKNNQNAMNGLEKIPDKLKEANHTGGSGCFRGEAPFKSSFSNDSGLKKFKEILGFFLEGLGYKKFTVPLCKPDKDGKTEYPVGGCRQKGHSEVKIINQALKIGPDAIAKKNLVIDVNLFQKVKGNNIKSLSKVPCHSCHRLICKVTDNCEIDVSLCNKGGEEVNMKQFCENGKPKENSRADMEDTLNDIIPIDSKTIF